MADCGTNDAYPVDHALLQSVSNQVAFRHEV
jgi:hypothetical protein